MIQYLQLLINARLAKMDERGATAVEYGLLVALIAAAIIAAVLLLKDSIVDAFSDTADSINKR
ncbi:Flp family type IVb pilin [Nocardioides sp. LHD-245]|uniref:Flp family type IVb pilin n=1 Tax=Nocardioides sp. LHD-245 TaxID=3051387 RepID=UPI0027E0A97E|nr:Flp family type IVb pilin [Nocardioides sp. LHD-245]